MPKLFKRTKELTVELCERCSRVCDATSRRSAMVERARDRAQLVGIRLS